MASVFAAAGQSADRRRRLIAHDGAIQDAELLSEFGIILDCELPAETPVDRLGERLIGRLISHRVWKHVAIVLAVLLTSTGLAFVLLKTDASKPVNTSVSSQFDNQLSIAALHSVLGLTTILLILSSQMAVLIGWLRSHSSIDFEGRYRSWYRLSWFLLILSVFSITGTSAVVTNLLAAVLQPATGTITAAKPALLFVPLVSAGLLIAWRLVPDMGRNRISQMLFVAAIGLTLACFSSLSPRVAAMLPPLVHAAGILLAASILFSACLLHCRFVAHINNDPPVAAYRSDELATRELAAVNATEQAGPSPAAHGPGSDVSSVSGIASAVNAAAAKAHTMRDLPAQQTAGPQTSNVGDVAESPAKESGASVPALRRDKEPDKAPLLKHQPASPDASGERMSKPKSARAAKARRTSTRKAG